MKRIAAAAVLAASVVIGPASTSTSHATTTPSTAVTAVAERQSATDRFAREAVRVGDQDASTSSIDHVHELQYRLTWAGVYRGPVTGYFGDLTEAAVKKYQRREGLRVNGVATRKTWRHLIPDSIRGRRAVPSACDEGRGWDVCYDRSRHQVTLWKNGRLHNSWLVRGGGQAQDLQTRKGHFKVYYRNADHVSGLYGSPMPYSQFFSGGQALHGSTYMIDPFEGHSHGCVNMYIEDARQLWRITSDRRLGVHVHGRWS